MYNANVSITDPQKLRDRKQFFFLCVFVFVLHFKMTEIYAWKKIFFGDFLFKQHDTSEEGKVILSSFIPYRVVLRGHTVDGWPYFQSTSRKNAKGPMRLWSFFYLT